MSETKDLIAKLNSSNSKEDFLMIIDNEFEAVSNYFTQKGHNLNREVGFIGQQILADEDLFLYLYYRDLHFIFWGLNGNWNTFDPLDKVYYHNLKRVIEALFELI